MFGMFDKYGKKSGESSRSTGQEGNAESSEKRLPPSNSFGNLSDDNRGNTPRKEVNSDAKGWFRELSVAYKNLDVPMIKEIVDSASLKGKRYHDSKGKYEKQFEKWLGQEDDTWSQYAGIKQPGLDLREVNLRISLLNCLKMTFNSKGQDEKEIDKLWNNLIQQYNILYPSQKHMLPECKR